MLEPHPPRRDPRVLVLNLAATPVSYAALDAFEVRGVGTVPRRGASRVLQRLLLQVRPSHVIVLPPVLSSTRTRLGAGIQAANRRGIVVLRLSPKEVRRLRAKMSSVSALARDFPELRHLVRTSAFSAVSQILRVAVAILFHHPLPPRHYVSRLSSRPPSRVAA